MTDERTTHNEMLEMMAGRKESLTTLLARANGEYVSGDSDDQIEAMEEAREELDNYPLEISTVTTLKVLLSTGGPADWLEGPIQKNYSGDYWEWERIGNITYHYAPWFDHDEWIVDDDSALAQYFDRVMESFNG